MKLFYKYLIILFLIHYHCSSANAANASIGPIYIESLTKIVTAFPGHQPGNFEVKVKNSFVVPSGLTCENTYITTLASADPEKQLFALLSMALVAQRKVNLIISDDASTTASPGRCSIIVVTLGDS